MLVGKAERNVVMIWLDTEEVVCEAALENLCLGLRGVDILTENS